MKFDILSEQEIEIYSTPDKKVKQRVITFKSEGLAPQTVWIDSDNLADVLWQRDNPGKKVPKEAQDKGDATRRAAFEAKVKQMTMAPPPRTV